MFVRKKINSSGSISVQILEKTNRTNKLIQTVGSSKDEIEIERLYRPPLHKGTKCDMRFKSSLNSARLNLLNPYK